MGGSGSSSGKGGGGGKASAARAAATRENARIKSQEAMRADDRAEAFEDYSTNIRSMKGVSSVARDEVVSFTRDVGGKSLQSAEVDTTRRGYFRVEFGYPSGGGYSETFDSAKSANFEIERFFKRVTY